MTAKLAIIRCPLCAQELRFVPRGNLYELIMNLQDIPWAETVLLSCKLCGGQFPVDDNVEWLGTIEAE